MLLRTHSGIFPALPFFFPDMPPPVIQGQRMKLAPTARCFRRRPRLVHGRRRSRHEPEGPTIRRHPLFLLECAPHSVTDRGARPFRRAQGRGIVNVAADSESYTLVRLATERESARAAARRGRERVSLHRAPRVESLRAFLDEYRVKLPVGVDAPDDDGNPIPQTMRAYAMQRTPTTILIDARGRLRGQVFGVHDDLVLGAELQTLLLEARSDAARAPVANASRPGEAERERCDDCTCAAPLPLT